MLEKQEYIYVYQTICEVNGKSYVGVHRTKRVNDGYIGCGVYRMSNVILDVPFHRAVRKYGYDKFSTYILSFYDTYVEALEEERFIVDKNWVKNKNNYNTALGGRGNPTSWMNDVVKDKWRNNIKKSVINWFNDGNNREFM